MRRRVSIAVLALSLAGLPSMALAQLDTGTGLVASKAVNKPLPRRHKAKPHKKPADCAPGSTARGCNKPRD